MITLPKAKDLSHLVDSRIGNPDADVTPLFTNSGIDGGTDWIDTDGDGVADDCVFVGGAGVCSIVTGNGFTGNAQRLTHVNGTSSRIYLDTGVDAIVGKTYKISGKYRAGAANWRIYLRSSANTATLNMGANTGDAISFSYIVTADDSSNITSTFYKVSSEASDWIEVDEVLIQEWDGEELVPDPDYGFVFNDASRWVPYANNIIEQDGNAIKTTYVDNANGALNTLNGAATEAFNLLSSGKVQFSFRAKVRTGLCYIAIWDGSSYNNIAEVTSSEWQYFTVQQEQLTSEPYVRFPNLDDAKVLWIEWLSVKKVTGLVAAYNMIPSPEGCWLILVGMGIMELLLGMLLHSMMVCMLAVRVQ
jgi:hypothetical protein